MMPRLGTAVIHSRVLFPFPKERERSREKGSRLRFNLGSNYPLFFGCVKPVL